MIIKLADGSTVERGAYFVKFSSDLETYHEGEVVETDGRHIMVDFGNFIARFERSCVNYYMQAEHMVREFFSSPSHGEIVTDYR